jgi:ABC-type phosphate transport system auxiliary subunit
MNLEDISQKHRNDLEQQVDQLMVTLRRTKLENDPLVEALQKLDVELQRLRRERFDMSNSEFSSY